MPIPYHERAPRRRRQATATSVEGDGPGHRALAAGGRLGYITLNRPEKLNALSRPIKAPAVIFFFPCSARQARAATRRCAGWWSSAGKASAAPSRRLRPAPDAEGRTGEGDAVDDRDRLQDNIDRWLRVWDFPKPVIAQVHGYCLAGATQLCVMTDLTIVAEDARIGLPSLPVGGGYISPMWTWLVGPKRAKEMSFIPGSQIDGRTASDWGFANRAVPAARLADEVRQTAEAIAVVPEKILRLKKMSINRTMDAQGFRVAVSYGVETDALLHASEPVRAISGSIRRLGLRGAIEQFRAGGADESAG
ncbi:MAG: enoyl-CoA hydratase-related protein [Dehalococcoidia bacterium]